MTLSSSETIDATVRGGVGRFLNHSCDPNCETRKVDGERRVVHRRFRAERDST